MSGLENGGGGADALSGLATTAGENPTGNDANVEQRPRALRRLIRCAAYSALAGAAVALVSHAALQLAMSLMGPPPLQAVAHLLPTAANSDAPKADLAPVPLSPDQVDARYLRMLFAFEDRRFYSHAGVDPFGIARAARDLVLQQRIVTGGSTLTMQVARLLDNQYRRTPSVKLRQIVRALQLEQRLTKRQILSLYLGLAPFGGRVKGVRAASLKYFG
jgi:penicillin-binding protein 1C